MSRKNRVRGTTQRKVTATNTVLPSPDPAQCDEGGIGRRGLILIIFAIVLILVGYFLLKKVDPAGSNVYSRLSPVFLLAGYLLIPVALYAKDPTESAHMPAEGGKDISGISR